MTMTLPTFNSEPGTWPDLTGRQEPEHLNISEGNLEHGEKALKLARRMTAPAMPWQSFHVKAILAQDEDGRWTHSDSCFIVPRQNGKSWILSVIVIYKLFVLHENIIFTAQQWKTAESLWQRTWAMVEARPSLRRRVRRKTCSQGRGTIELTKSKKTGKEPQVVFTTRSADAGRGLDEVDTLIYDECYNLTESEIAALAFTQLAADDPQTIYTSSAVNAEQHPNGEVLAAMRERGLAGDDPDFFFSEYMAPEHMDRESEEAWKHANPSYGVIQTRTKIEKLMRSMNTEAGQKAFDVEALGRGDWPVIGGEIFEPIIDLDEWAARHEPDPIVIGDSCMAVDVTPEADRVGLVAAVRTDEGVHLSLSPEVEFNRDAVVKSIREAVESNDPLAVVLDPAGPASTLENGLQHEDIEPERMNARKVVQATELFLQLWHEGRITHDGDPRWVDALNVAEFRNVKEMGRALTRQSGVVCDLVAATFAVWGLHEFEIPLESPVKEKKKFTYVPLPVSGSNYARSMQF